MIINLEFYKNKKNEIQYHSMCQQCKNDCKQSYKIKYLFCPKFTKVSITH
jgi:hypothetical protein